MDHHQLLAVLIAFAAVSARPAGRECFPPPAPQVTAFAGICGSPGTGNCCQPNDSPGCDDLECCQTVCEVDPFCCDTMWDAICAGEAAELCCLCSCCVGCGYPETGDCCAANGTPFCEDYGCCESVCAIDPFCCESEWDVICAEGAGEVCSVCGGCFETLDQEIICHADGAAFTVVVRGIDACTGSMNTYTFTASGGAQGELLCFTILVQTDQGGLCCSTQVCVTVPECPAGGRPGSPGTTNHPALVPSSVLPYGPDRGTSSVHCCVMTVTPSARRVVIANST